MKHLIIFLISICLATSSCRQSKVTEIIGKINNPSDSTVKINDSIISINDSGDFIYEMTLNKPSTAVLIYKNTEILLYLTPSRELSVLFEDNNLINTIRFEGDDAEVNKFLVSLAGQSLEVSPWFDKNWYELYSKSEEDFIRVIDSLQSTFLAIFEDFNARHDFPDSVFIKGLIADTYFSFSRLILLYPSQHEDFTGEQVSFSQSTTDRLSSVNINESYFINLDHYESFCREWIEYNLQNRLKNNASPKNYYLKRMDELFLLLPEMFTNHEIRDFWLAGYMSGFIENYGISNSRDYMNRFNLVCSTEKYKLQVENTFLAGLEANRDHSVEIFKTINGFHLEAHIFYPGTRKPESRKPAIVLFHGGGWAEGNPAWTFSRARHFARKGMIAIGAQYRLSNRADITPLEGMEDARDMISWMRSKADSIGIHPDSIVAYGWSAGGHLATAAAIFPEISSGAFSPVPNALILVSPAVDLVNDDWSQYLLGSRAGVSTISPVNHVRKNLPPTIILQGRDDTVTPLSGAKLFYELMLAAGNDCELWIYDGVGHLFTPSTMRDDGWPMPDPHVQQEAYEQADEFLRERGYLK